jgi:Skp family chaperone for outer membrane proteins
VLNVKSSLRCAALAAVLIGLGYFGCQLGDRNQVSAQQAYPPPAGTNVAVLDVQYVFKNHLRFQQEIEYIRKDIEAFKSWAAQQQQAIQAEAKKLEQFNPGTKEYKDVEETVARQRVNFQLESAKRQKEFLEREAKVYYNIYQEVERAVSDFAARNRIGLVLRYSNEPMDPAKRETIMQGINRLVIYENRLNITDMIVDLVNRGTPPAASAPAIAPTGAPRIGTRPPMPTGAPPIPRRN